MINTPIAEPVETTFYIYDNEAGRVTVTHPDTQTYEIYDYDSEDGIIGKLRESGTLDGEGAHHAENSYDYSNEGHVTMSNLTAQTYQIYEYDEDNRSFGRIEESGKLINDGAHQVEAQYDYSTEGTVTVTNAAAQSYQIYDYDENTQEFGKIKESGTLNTDGDHQAESRYDYSSENKVTITHPGAQTYEIYEYDTPTQHIGRLLESGTLGDDGSHQTENTYEYGNEGDITLLPDDPEPTDTFDPIVDDADITFPEEIIDFDPAFIGNPGNTAPAATEAPPDPADPVVPDPTDLADADVFISNDSPILEISFYG
jgi:hypothetical protein